MDRRPNLHLGVRSNVRGVENVGNVGTPAFSQYPGTGRSESSNLTAIRGSRRRNRQKNRNQGYFSDHQLLSRMKQYLEQNTDTVEVDFEHMADYFRTRFRDYANRKNDALRGLLVRGHDAIMAEFEANAEYTSQLPPLLPGSPDPDSEDFADDDDGSFTDSINQSNMQLTSLYNSTANRRQSQRARNTEELINISSSDEGSNEAKKMRPAPKDDLDRAVRNEPKIPPLLPPHILSVIRKADTEVYPAVSFNGGANHANSAKPAVTVSTVTSQNANDAYVASRKRKVVAAVDQRKPVSGPSKKKREVAAVSPTATFKDFGGNARVLSEVCKLLVHMRHPEVYRQIGVSPPRGFLLHGPPGCGKTLLAHAIAGELQVPLIKVASPELVAGVSGESEERVRDLFAQAVAAAPCVLFLDEVDAVTPNRHTAQREMERRIVAQLLSSLDELGQQEFGDQVLVIGATNRPDSIDPALRRAGRFDREVCLGIPDLDARRQILKVLCGKLRLAGDLSFDDIARNTPGYVGADLMALTREAAMAAVNRVFGELKHAAAANAAASEKSGTGAADEVILVHDEPKANEDKDVVDVDVDVDDAAKGVANGKGKEAEKSADASDDKMDVCEVVGDNSDCIVLDETPEKPAESKGAEAKEKEDGAKEDEVKAVDEKEEKSKEKEKPEVEEKKIEETKDLDDKGKEEKTMETVEAGKEETKDSANDATAAESKEEPMDTETSAVPDAPKPPPGDGAGPDLTELISWLHDVAPLTPAQLELLHVERRDFELALKAVQPSAKREGFATVPDVTWDDVGALADIRDELQMAILAPVKHAEQFAALGLTTPTGVLLCGPPGCGKTFLAKAVANEAGVNFISVKGPELLNMYVGESERAVRQCFQRARNSAPCVIFFDELDALCPKRSDSGEGGASMRVVNQMLTEMDGVEGRKDVYLMAATNRPDIVDPAVLRPGRLDKILYVGMPSGPDRVLILQALTKSGSKPTLCADVSLKRLGECRQTDGYTGADLAALVREASMQSLREHLASGADSALAVADKHFDLALAKIRPSVSEKDRKYYEKLREVYTAVPSAKSG